jgi:hypothetical protein
MTIKTRVIRSCVAILAAGALCGCASADGFAGRLSHYNTEAEQAQDQAILLNILRAEKRRPLSFTELQNVTSSGTASGGLGLTVPLAQNGGATASTFSPSLSLSGGPTLAAGFINTQEFYQGILRPIPIATIDLFIQRGIPSNLLFNLLFSRVIVKKIQDPAITAAPETFTATNDVGSPRRLAAYQTLMEVLLNRGLTTGPDKPDSTIIGPPLTDADLADSDLVTKAVTAGMQVQEADWCDLDDLELQSLWMRRTFALARIKAVLTPQCEVMRKADPHSPEGRKLIAGARKEILGELAAGGAPLVYRMEKSGSGGGFHFCTAGLRSEDGEQSVNPGICDSDSAVVNPAHTTTAKAYSVRISKLPMVASTQAGQQSAPIDHLCAALNDLARSGDALNCADRNWDGEGFEVELEPRSTYGVLYYLGEVVRAEVPPERSGDRDLTPRFVMVKIGNRLAAIPNGVCDQAGRRVSLTSEYVCQTLFYLRPGQSGRRAFLSVHYDGQDYSVPDDGEAGKTNEVLDIVNELIALNHSSKDSPTSSLLTVVGVH